MVQVANAYAPSPLAAIVLCCTAESGDTMAALLYEIWRSADGSRQSLHLVSRIDDELRARLDRGARLVCRFWASSRLAALREQHRRLGSGVFRQRAGDWDRLHDGAEAAAQRAYLEERPRQRRERTPAPERSVRRAPPRPEAPMPPRAQAGLWRYRFRARRRVLRHAHKVASAA